MLEPTFFEISAATLCAERIGLMENNGLVLLSDAEDRLVDLADVLPHILGTRCQWRNEVSKTFLDLEIELHRRADESEFTIFITSVPITYHKYSYMGILRFKRAAWGGRTSAEGNPSSGSLAEALKTIALDEIQRRHASESFRSTFTELAPRELLYRAAERLLLDVGKTHNLDAFRTTWVFHEILAISTLRYERRESTARLLLTADPDPPLRVRLHDPVGLGDHRAARKILEMASNEAPAIGTFEQILGLGDVQSSRSRALEVRFNGFHSWTILYEEQPLMSVTAGVPRLPRGRLNEDEFRATMPFCLSSRAWSSTP